MHSTLSSCGRLLIYRGGGEVKKIIGSGFHMSVKLTALINAARSRFGSMLAQRPRRRPNIFPILGHFVIIGGVGVAVMTIEHSLYFENIVGYFVRIALRGGIITWVWRLIK